MSVLAVLQHALIDGGLLALPAALLGGVLAGVNPCCIPMYPAAVATCCALRDERKPTLPGALALVAGIAVAMAVLGMAAAAAGRTLTALGGWVTYALAVVPLVAGAHVLGWLRIPSLRLPAVKARTGGAFLAGLLLSLVMAPCGTPMLASILSYAAARGNLAYGGTLLLAYGMGASIPVLVLGVSATKLATRLDSNGLRAWVDRAVGALLIGLGFYLLLKA